jgi:hypothetical protein
MIQQATTWYINQGMKRICPRDISTSVNIAAVRTAAREGNSARPTN